MIEKIPIPTLVDFRSLEQPNRLGIKPDLNYQDSKASLMDAAYQYLLCGVLPSEPSLIPPQDIKIISSITDNYRFIRKHFSTYWYIYVFLIRLLTLNNPFIELKAFYKNLKTKRIFLSREISITNDKFNSLIPHDPPMVSVVIPTLNRYGFLKDILSDLEAQDYPNFEVIICDQTEPFNAAFYEDWNLKLHIYRQEEKALWLARNSCVRNANGNLIAFAEDDIRVQHDWLSNHVKCIYAYNADASCGIFYPSGSFPAPSQKIFKLSEQFPTGNTLIRKEVFSVTGLFDRQFEGQRMGDGEFGLRCLLAGFRLIQNPLASCLDIKAPTGGLRQQGSWDSLRPKSILAPRPIPSVLYYIRKYFGDTAAIYYLIQQMPQAFIPYRWKRNKLLRILTVGVVPLLLPLIIYVTSSSWKQASQKLQEGAIIDYNE